jgi:copper resistance protein B
MNPIKGAFIAAGACWFSIAAQAQQHDHERPQTSTATQDAGQSELEHVAPEAPVRAMPDMSYREMVLVMDMDDRRPYHRLQINQVELQRTGGSTAISWDGEFFWGGDYDKVGLKSKGEDAGGQFEDARVEVVWDRIYSRWWSGQLGIRHDWGNGPTRDWISVGTRGLAPYFFDIEATAYVAEGGRTALRFSVDYDLLLTQRLVLRPKVELNAYGKDDPTRELMSGLSDLEFGLRLRYEIRREIAPYLGVSWARALGDTADLRSSRGTDPSQLKALAGIRLNF